MTASGAKRTWTCFWRPSSASNWYNIVVSFKSLTHCSRDCCADSVRRLPQRVGIEMCVARSGLRPGMTKQLANDRQPHAATGTERRKVVAQVV